MWGSKLLGNYATKMLGTKAGGAMAMAGVKAASAATGRYGATAAGAVWGGVGGAAWGAVSDDTSVIGGALMGAGLGAGAARYGGAGLKAYRRGRMPGDGSPAWAGRQLAGRVMRSAAGQMKGDALLASNKAMNGFNAMRRRTGF